MRRTLAILLLDLFSFTLMAPLLFGESEAKIAACCRRDGKHHCARMAATAPADDGAIRITNSKVCPLFPPGGSAPVSPNVAVPPPVPVLISAIVALPAPAEACIVMRRIAAARAWLKRGPPSHLA